MADTETLVTQLLEAREAYYSSDSPLMSDAEFDRLEDELRRWIRTIAISPRLVRG